MGVILAVQVKTGYEKKVQAILTKCYENEFKRQQINILTTERDLNLSKQYLKKEMVLLPGYLLIKCSKFTNELYYQIKKVPGVIRILSEAIPKSEMYHLVKNVRIKVLKHYRSYAQKMALQKGFLKAMFKNLFKYKNKKIKSSVGIIKYKVNALKSPEFIFYLE